MNFARLYLRSAAAEQLDALSLPASAEPNVRALRELVARLPDDRVLPQERHRVCRANLEVLLRANRLTSHDDLEEVMRAWVAGLESWVCCRAGDGNLIRRRTDGRDWLRLADDAGEARALQLPPVPAGGRSPPWVIEGLDPPWYLQRVLGATPRQPDRYWARVALVQADPLEFLDGLSVVDLTDELSQERLTVFVGATAGADLAADLDRRSGTLINGPSLVSGGVRTRVSPPVERLIVDAAGRQLQEEEHLRDAVREVYSGRDRSWWARRYAEARGDKGGEPLRVLIPTCLYSTFVRHSAADLASALRQFEGQGGCQVRVLVEPDESSLLSTVAYLREMLDFQPDLVVLINYTRANLEAGGGAEGRSDGGVMPPEVPCVCWIQDAMPHLFDAAIGRAQTGLDFVAGHTHPELFERFGYPADRAATFPVVASTAKFHDGRIDGALAEQMQCEIAMVTHHSETPESMHARLCREAGGGGAATPVVRIFERLFLAVKQLSEQAATRPVLAGLRQLAVEGSRATLGREPDDRLLALLVNQYAAPLADRVIRHQTLAWAAGLAQRRPWRLRIYGRGWEKHPTLAPFAAGELEHGEALRAAYQGAAVQLHASANWMYHQRVMECALSGGLPACRLKDDDLGLLLAHAQLVAARDAQQAATLLGPERLALYRVADVPEGMRLSVLWQRLGHRYAGSPWIWSSPERLARARAAWGSLPMSSDAAWLVGDPSETTFVDGDGLERLVERAVERPAWRQSISTGIARRVRGHFTYDRAGRTILDMVARSLAAGETGKPPIPTLD